jgi:hypothetical protein
MLQYEWHHKFAWLPVRLGCSNLCAWLQWVNRRRARNHHHFPTDSWTDAGYWTDAGHWEYQLIESECFYP